MQNYTSEEFNSLNLSNYRHVPITLKIKILFGGIFSIVGWIFLGIGLLVNSALIPMMSFNSVQFGEDSPQTTGKVVSIRGTNTTVNNQRVMECEYTFEGPDGNEYTGAGYGYYNIPRIGETVQIQYLADDPSKSRMIGRDGISTGAIPYVFLVFLIFPLIGLGMLIGHWVIATKKIRLLQSGTVTMGKYSHKFPTNTRINNRTVYKIAYKFEAGDGETYEAYARSHRHHEPRFLEDQVIFYNAINPRKALVKNDLPGPPRMTMQGNLEPPSMFALISSLFVPALVITLVSLFLMFVLPLMGVA